MRGPPTFAQSLVIFAWQLQGGLLNEVNAKLNLNIVAISEMARGCLAQIG